MGKKIGVLLVTDLTLLRQGLSLLLADDTAVSLVGEAMTGEEAITRYKAVRPDVVLLCLEPPAADPLSLIAALRRHHTAVRIIVLERTASAANLIAAVQAGVMGYLLAETSVTDLIAAIQTVHAGQPALSSELTLQLVEAMKRPFDPTATSSPDKLLTQREIDIVCLVAQGLSNQEIADNLIISERTVRTHISHALLKLSLSNRTQLALYALRHRWVNLDAAMAEK
jgi:two-component system, NarL family, response regulator LiaR